jgi:transcriptional regulator with GAF, ATPase, and Fis domain
LLDEIRSEQNFGDIIGESPGLRKVMQQIQHVAPTEATVPITGESGTGKELVALVIHEHSARNGRPLIKLSCSAAPEGLFESEFFGHVKGAFTGAFKDKLGRFELADGGTLFLDEIGEVPLAMQAKLRAFERFSGRCGNWGTEVWREVDLNLQYLSYTR